MNRGLWKIKQAWDEQPMTVIVVLSGAAYSTSKLLDSITGLRNSRTWNKEVGRRIRKTK